MTNKAWFRTGVAVLLLFLIIKLFIEVNFIFKPIIVIVQSILLPLLISGFLFYICLPFQKMMEKRRVPRWASITIILLALTAIGGAIFGVVGPVIATQIENLIHQLPYLQKETQNLINFALDQRDKLPNEITEKINEMISKFGAMTSEILSNSLNIVTSVISTLFLLILVPFFLIYMLKDHERFIPAVARFFNGERKIFVVNLLKDLNQTLMSYIQGQVTVSLILGAILYAGYTIIGLEYTLLLVMFAIFANMIPFLGPWMAFLPAGILGIIQSPTTFIWVCVVTLIAQQLEGNVITPNVMGKSLNIHPLTIIVVILASGSLGGFVLILVAVPLYAVLKSIARNIYKYRHQIIHAAQKNVNDH
ncbi:MULTISPECIES: AI-2E family transporter [unclassified Staphylococcus]|uniref:lipoteichoic acid biosynthesis protein CozEa n=1 Tax=unclassified Staphylococcus TaxID=91994 RepID=UPI0021D026AB|nr:MULTISPECIES: AI-2E family transporter [unclassified Staphylococcus]UXR78894.1 AI-2E family transporter [Staphylococcus sp. IVB6227]UXR83055.1 AI-2E family transporter [Staphylococcus sp. IVB6214]